MGYSTREKKPVSYTYEYNVSDDDDDVYEYNVSSSKEKKKKDRDINGNNDSDFNSSNSDSQYWKKSKNPLKRKSLQEKKEDAQLRQVLKLSMLEQGNHHNSDNIEIVVNERPYVINNINNENEIENENNEDNVLTDELVNDDVISELSKTDVSDISSISLESDSISQPNKENEVYQLDDSSSDFDDFKPSKKSKKKEKEKEKEKEKVKENLQKTKSTKRKRSSIENDENIISSGTEDNYDENKTKIRIREHTPVLSKNSDDENYDNDDDVYKEEDEDYDNYVSDKNDDSDDDYDDYNDSRKKNSKRKKTTSKTTPKSTPKSSSKTKSSIKKETKLKTSKTVTPKKKESVIKKTVIKKSINSPITIKSPKQTIGISRSSIKLPNSSTSKLKSINTPINSSIMSRPPRIGLSRKVHIKPLHSYLHHQK